MAFWDARMGQPALPTREQIVNAQLHWMVRKDWSNDLPSDNYGAAPSRIAALFPALRWEVQHDASGSMEPADAATKKGSERQGR
jgi:hypothetical protein